MDGKNFNYLSMLMEASKLYENGEYAKALDKMQEIKKLLEKAGDERALEYLNEKIAEVEAKIQ